MTRAFCPLLIWKHAICGSVIGVLKKIYFNHQSCTYISDHYIPTWKKQKRFLYFNLHCSLSRDDKLISRITRTYHLWLIPVPPQNRTETDHVTCQRFWSRSVDLCIRKRISNLKYKFVYYFESNFRYIYLSVNHF